jgi:hypothetical protein
MLVAGVLAGARPVAAQDARACLFELLNVDRKFSQRVAGADTSLYAGGNVRIRCGASTMASDSVEVLGGTVARFMGRVRYTDSTLSVQADTGTYHKFGERWEARGRVQARNLETGSAIRGPSVDYLRRAAGVRDTIEMWATGRPRISYVARDSAEGEAEPYIIVADRVRMRGEDQVWAGGRVTVDRSDFSAHSDSLRLDTGEGNDGTLVGGAPTLKGLRSDTFTVTGTRIDFRLRERELVGLLAAGKAHAVTDDWDLTSDSLALALEDEKLEETRAWGGDVVAKSEKHDVTADSLVIETPDQRLRELRAYGDAWLAAAVDSATKERDWIAGDTVLAAFEPRDSADAESAALRQMTAIGSARAFQQTKDEDGGPPSLNYLRADRIVIRMKATPPGVPEEVAEVEVKGHVDGVRLEPGEGGRREGIVETPAGAEP